MYGQQNISSPPVSPTTVKNQNSNNPQSPIMPGILGPATMSPLMQQHQQHQHAQAAAVQLQMMQAATAHPAQAAMAQAAANAQAAHAQAAAAAAQGQMHQMPNQMGQMSGQMAAASQMASAQMHGQNIYQQVPIQGQMQAGQHVAAQNSPFPVPQGLSQQQAAMHAQAMQQAQYAMHQQMQTVQYLHAAPAVMPTQYTSQAQSYHHQQQQAININIQSGVQVSETTAAAPVSIVSGNDVKISEAKTIVPDVVAVEQKSVVSEGKEEKWKSSWKLTTNRKNIDKTKWKMSGKKEQNEKTATWNRHELTSSCKIVYHHKKVSNFVFFLILY